MVLAFHNLDGRCRRNVRAPAERGVVAADVCQGCLPVPAPQSVTRRSWAPAPDHAPCSSPAYTVTVRLLAVNEWLQVVVGDGDDRVAAGDVTVTRSSGRPRQAPFTSSRELRQPVFRHPMKPRVATFSSIRVRDSRAKGWCGPVRSPTHLGHLRYRIGQQRPHRQRACTRRHWLAPHIMSSANWQRVFTKTPTDRLVVSDQTPARGARQWEMPGTEPGDSHPAGIYTSEAFHRHRRPGTTTEGGRPSAVRRRRRDSVSGRGNRDRVSRRSDSAGLRAARSGVLDPGPA